MNRLDDYSATLTRAMKGVPRASVAQEIGKVLEHIGLLIEHNRNQGLTDSDATAEAIRQYGSAQAVGRKLRTTWLRANPLVRGSFLKGFAVCLALEIIWWNEQRVVISCFNLQHLTGAGYLAIYGLMQIVCFFGIGWLAASVSPKRAIVAVAASIVLELALSIGSIYFQVIHNSQLRFLFEFVVLGEVPLRICLAVVGAMLAQKYLVHRARRLA